MDEVHRLWELPESSGNPTLVRGPTCQWRIIVWAIDWMVADPRDFLRLSATAAGPRYLALRRSGDLFSEFTDDSSDYGVDEGHSDVVAPW